MDGDSVDGVVDSEVEEEGGAEAVDKSRYDADDAGCPWGDHGTDDDEEDDDNDIVVQV